jgi:hypothetical protein
MREARSLMPPMVALVMLAAIAGGRAATVPMSPDAIFSRARDVIRQRVCPWRIEYEIVVAATVNGRLEQNHFRATYLSDDDYLHVRSFSQEEQDHPYVPHGTNILMTTPVAPLIGLSRALTEKIDPDGPPADLLGVPMLRPTFTFGLSRNAAATDRPEQSGASSPSDFQVIGSARSVARDYRVSLLAVEPYDRGQAYHLALSPERDPKTYRLRELWVDTESFVVLKIMTAGNFDRGPSLTARWLTTFQTFDDCRIVDTETALDTLDFGRGRQYVGTTVSFEILQTPEAYAQPILIFRKPADGDDLMEPD